MYISRISNRLRSAIGVLLLPAALVAGGPPDGTDRPEKSLRWIQKALDEDTQFDIDASVIASDGLKVVSPEFEGLTVLAELRDDAIHFSTVAREAFAPGTSRETKAALVARLNANIPQVSFSLTQLGYLQADYSAAYASVKHKDDVVLHYVYFLATTVGGIEANRGMGVVKHETGGARYVDYKGGLIPAPGEEPRVLSNAYVRITRYGEPTVAKLKAYARQLEGLPPLTP